MPHHHFTWNAKTREAISEAVLPPIEPMRCYYWEALARRESPLARLARTIQRGARRHARHEACLALVWVVVSSISGLLLPLDLQAQGGLDRNLGRERVDRSERQATTEGIKAVDTRTLRADWLVQPLASASTDANDVGVRAGLSNTDRFGSIPWLIAVRGVRRTVDDVSHGRWVADGYIAPSLPNLGKSTLGLLISGTHAQTFSVSRFDELSAELDFGPNPNITLSGVAYYNWSKPTGESLSHGAYFGVLAEYMVGQLKVAPEYDFDSDINGGDFYSVVGSLVVHRSTKGRTVTLRGGWEKGDTFSFRLQFGIPSNRTVPSGRRLR
jgi:hypothetical protein